MSDTTAEIIAACEALPPSKQAEVASFAKFLLAQADEARWEEIVNDPQPRPKFKAFIEGQSPKAASLSALIACDLPHHPYLPAGVRSADRFSPSRGEARFPSLQRRFRSQFPPV